MLPRKVAQAAESRLYLADGVLPETVLFPVLEFDAGDPLLPMFLEAAQSPRKGRWGRAFLAPSDAPLLQEAFHFRVYDTADLLEYPLVQLTVSHVLALTRPLSQYYHADIAWTPECHSCGQVLLTQTSPLRLADPWPDKCDIAETDNYELLVSNKLKEIWQATLLTDEVVFQEAATRGTELPIWQVKPQFILPVAIPPTSVASLDNCAACGRPLTVTVRQFHPDKPTHEMDAYLHVNPASVPPGNLWQTDILQGRLRLPRRLLEKHMHNPEPSFVRTGRPFWVISHQLLKLFQQHHFQGWTGKPIRMIK